MYCNDISYMLKESEPRFICFCVPSKILHHNFYRVFTCGLICDKLLLCNRLSRGLNITHLINTDEARRSQFTEKLLVRWETKSIFNEITLTDKHFFIYQNG